MHVVKPLCPVSKLSTESFGSRRELANCVHTADADATQLASAVCIGLKALITSDAITVKLLQGHCTKTS